MMTLVSKLALVLLIACVTANRSYAEEQHPAVDVATIRAPALAVQRGLGRAPSQHGCCNKKGALIGAVSGATIAALWVLNTCDAGDCVPTYLKYMGVLGGIGATVGAFADVSPRVATFPDRRVRVAGVFSPTKRAVVATVRLGRRTQ